jgi:sulfite reductase alpha subunit-like flavoprotein
MHIYCFSDAKNMARDVNQCMIDMAIQIGGLIPEQANRWVQDLRSSGRYLEDVWS